VDESVKATAIKGTTVEVESDLTSTITTGHKFANCVVESLKLWTIAADTSESDQFRVAVTIFTPKACN